ncbi:MAG: patatin-like phospholipase family protein [Deltaproteobacteria bacterium]|nr:patatin-like phospholipase family protein [Deltaproteobacteria bacterium]
MGESVKRALVMSGGGAKGIWEVGCLSRLLEKERDLDFDFFLGVSAGSLNATFLAQAPMEDGCGGTRSKEALRDQAAALARIWHDEIQGTSDVYEGDIGEKIGLGQMIAVGIFGKDSLADAAPIRSLIDRYVDPALLARSKRQLHIGAASLQSGAYFPFDQSTTDIRLAVKASTAVPGIFAPIEWERDLLVDGAIRNNTPLGKAFDARPEIEIYVIQTSPIEGHVPAEVWDMRHKSALDVLYRIAVIMSDEVLRDDIVGAREWNRAIKALEDVKVAVPAAAAAIDAEIAKLGKIRVPTRIYAPPEKLLDDELIFDKRDLDEMWLKGRARADQPPTVW